MGEFGDYFKTWNWEAGFRYSRNEGQDLSVGEASQPGLRPRSWIRTQLRRLIRSLASLAATARPRGAQFMLPCKIRRIRVTFRLCNH